MGVPSRDGQPVFAALAEAAARLSEASETLIYQRDGGQLRLVARHGAPRAARSSGKAAGPLGRSTIQGRAALDRVTIRTGALVATPMLRNGTPVGVIVARGGKARPFSPAQVGRLEAFAAQAAVVVEEMEGRDRELAEAREQQAATAEILRAISISTTDTQAVFDMIAENALRLCHGQFGGVFRFDGEEVHLASQHGLTPEGGEVYASVFPRPPGRDSAIGRALLQRAIVHIPDVRTDPEYGLTALAVVGSMACVVAVPVLREGTPIGGIVAWRSTPEPFPDRQIELLKTFADQALIAIENARLVADLGARNRELTETLEQQTATAEILRAISGSPTDIQPVLDTVARAAARFCGAPDVVISRLDGQTLCGAAGVGPFSEVIARHVGGSLAGLRVQVTRGAVTGRAVVDRRTVHVRDLAAESEDEFPDGRDLQRRFGHRTMVAAPLLREGTPLGTIALFRTAVDPFSDKQLELLRVFADQAVIAIENVRLFTELEARNRALTESLEQQTVTAEILRIISTSPTDLQPVLQAVAENAARLCGADDGHIWQREGATLHRVASWGGQPVARQQLTIGRRSVVGRAAHDRAPVHVEDLFQAFLTEFPDSGAMKELGYRTILAVPLLREGVAIGVIMIRRTEVRPFTDKQIALVKTFADQAVIAIENVRLFRELETRNRDLTETLEQQTATSEILRVISSSPTDVQPVFDTIARSAKQLCDADTCAVFRFDGQLLHFVAHYGLAAETVEANRRAYPTPADRGSASGRSVLSGVVEQIPDVHADPDYTIGGIARISAFRSIVAVPMLRDGIPIGSITVRRVQAGTFPDRQIELLKTFADQAVIAIENVRLFTELEVRNRDLTETLEQQTATGEILRVISSSPTDVQPVFDTIAQYARRLCDAEFCQLYRFDGTLLHFVAYHGLSQEGAEAVRRAYPMAPGRASAAARSVLSGFVEQVPDVDADPDYGHGAVARAANFKSVVGVPMVRDGVPIGSIAVARVEAGPFPDRQLELLKTFADQAVIAIENVRLFKELEVRNRDLTEALEQQTATSEILRVISSSPTDIQPVFDTIARSAAQLCEAQFCHLFRFDGTLLHFVAHHGLTPEGVEAFRRAFPVAPDRGSSAGRAALSGTLHHIPDVHADPDYRFGELARFTSFRSIVAVPMVREGRVIGTVNVGRAEAGHFSDRQLDLLKTFADQAVIAIENVRLFTELEARNRDLTETLEQQTATSEILRVISSSPTDVQPVFDTIAASALRLCDAKWSAVTRFDGSLIELASHYGLSDPAGIEAIERAFPRKPSRHGATDRAIVGRVVGHYPDVLDDPNYQFQDMARAAGYRSMLAVPMVREGQAVGAITVAGATARTFSDRQIELLKTFADQAVIAIENVRLFKELEAKNRDLTETLEQRTATSEILRVISSSPTDVQPVFDIIGERAEKLCDAAISVVSSFDGELLHLVSLHGVAPAGEDAIRNAFPMRLNDETVSARAVKTRAVVHVADVLHDARYQQKGTARRSGYRGCLGVPMVREGQVTGVIFVARTRPGLFTDTQVELLKTFADQAVIAIQNVRLFTELEARNAELTGTLARQTATGEVLRAISRAQTDAQPVFDIIAASALRLCSGGHSGVWLYDGELVHLAALENVNPEGAEAIRRAFPRRADERSAVGRAVLARAVVQITDVHEDPAYGLGRVADTAQFRSFLATPMLRDGELIGVIGVGRPEPGPFPDTQIELLRTFADQAVIAIENVRLFRELEARNRDLTETLEQQTATGEILRVISSSPTDIQPVLDTIVQSAVRLCDGLYGAVNMFDGEMIQRTAASHNYTPEALAVVERMYPMRPSHRQLTGRAILSRAFAHLPDVLNDPEYAPDIALAGGWRSALAAPMLREGHPIGTILVTRTQTGPFSDRQIELLKTFADQAVIAIENVRLFKELEARTQDLTRSVGELKALGEVSQAVGSTLDLETVLETIVSRAVQLSGSDGGIVYEFEEASQSFHLRATHRISSEHLEVVRSAPIRLGEGAVGRAGVTREPVQVADTQEEWQLIPAHIRALHVREGTRALLAVPLVREDQLLGGLVITRHELAAFSPEVVATLQAFATQSVLAIHNAGLFREIQRRKQYADAIVETSPVAIATLDLDGKVVGWNPGAERLFGYTPAEAFGRPLWDLVATVETREEVRAGLQQGLRGERRNLISRRARKDGTLVDVEISATPVIVGGAEVGIVATYHDITDLLRARREAEAANEAKSSFLATMSHEIRTPLNAVIGMSGLLLNTPLADEQREYAEIVRQSGDALLTVINDILDFSKIEAGKLELEAQPFDLRECVEGALDLVAARATEKGLDLAYLFAEGTPAVVLGDVTRLRQVLLNLLSNAVKFTERGEVVLSVAAHRLDGSGLHEVTFAVRDTGIGIPPDRLGRLFQSFSQVDASTTRRYGGTGLGLAISQRLTELMGGRIGVTSEIGVGSEFRFTIRAAAAAEGPRPVRRDLSGVQPSLHGKRVLVVDDNATNRRIVTTHLGNWGLPARATESPREALAWVEAREEFDVGILDMHMPEMDGISLARSIRQHAAGAELPLILFTSLGRREARAEEEGFAAYLHKPIKPSQLFDALVSVLADQPVRVSERGVARSELDPDLARRHPLRILLAEDNVVNQKVALRLLGQMGYRTDVAGNGLEAIDAVERQAYDVVLMDVQMPELDGFEASREINRRWPGERRPRIVAMTANAMQGDRELCAAAGMDDYVAKPIRVEELVAALERCPRRADSATRGAATAGGRGADASKESPVAPTGSRADANDTPPAGAPAVAHVDRAAVERLTATMGGAFVAELIDTFAEDARDLISALRRALAETDVDAFRRAAHSLKSTSETLGAMGLAGLARELETQARAGSLEGAAARLEQLAGTCETVTRTLGEIRHDLPA